MIHLRRPLVVALLAFLAGLLLALRFGPPPLPALAAALAILLVLGLHGPSGSATPLDRWLIALLFLGVGTLSGTLTRTETLGDCRANFEDGEEMRLRGTLGAAHRPAERGTSTPLLPLLEPEIVGRPGCAGEIRVRLPPDLSPLLPGDRVEVAGAWRLFSPPVRPSPFPRDPRFHGFLVGYSAQALPATGRDPALALRARADLRLARLFPGHVEIVEALLLGRREYVSPELRDRYSRAGLSHLLAISGMHVGLLSAVVLLVGSALRLARRHAVLLTLGLTWIYLLVIGAGPSALRAGVMITLSLVAVLAQRPSAAAPIVAAAALALVALRPLSILDPGLQLSFAGVLGILLLRAPLLTLAPDRFQHRSHARNLLDAFVVGVAAFLVTAPIVAHHFGIVAPISMLVGLPAVPMMSLALVGTLAALATDLILPSLAALLAGGAAIFLDLLERLATAAAAVPFGNAPVPRPPWWAWTVAAGGALVISRVAAAAPRRLRRMIASGTALSILVIWPLLVGTAPGRLEIHFIDVGQGDAVALRTPGDRWILVDAGPASDNFDAGEERVLPYLRDRGARRIELFLLTHPDLDHIGGAAAVLRTLPVRYVFEPGMPVGKDIYLDLLRGIDTGSALWRAARSGRTLELDGVRIEMLWPDPETVDVAEDANQISAVARLSFGEFSLLLTGDVGVEVEELLVDRHGAALEADILKLGHHGSATSSAARFLDAVAPRLAVVSAGRRNRYGHPAPAVIDRVTRRGIAVVGTHTDGSLMFEVEPGGRTWQQREW